MTPDDALHERANSLRVGGSRLMAAWRERGRATIAEARLQGLEATAKLHGHDSERLRDGAGGERVLMVSWRWGRLHYRLVCEAGVFWLDRSEAAYYLADSVTMLGQEVRS
jgi:hypothetical protein